MNTNTNTQHGRARTIVVSIVAVFVLLGIIGALSSKPASKHLASTITTVAPATVTTSAPAPVVTTAPKPAPTVAPKPVAPKPTVPAAPVETAGQANARESASSYLDMGTGFSRTGLIQQLSSAAGEGFSLADATYGVDAHTVDWNAQAVASAKGYLSFTSFSRSGLIQQLTSSAGDGYTQAQAVFAANAVGL